MRYRPEIDGLRALAVLPVILFHAGFSVFSGGFIGVDVFFVISGYLITTHLLEEMQQQRFSLISFYERRARRILPALFLVMLVCLPAAWLWLLPDPMRDFSQSLVAVTFFASNVLFWKESGYFAAASEEKPLLHTWSLAVEEQYYILFPLMLLFAWRYGRQYALWAVVLLAAMSFALCEWASQTQPTANFYLAPMRAWELLAGSLTAFALQKEGVRANHFLSAGGLLLIVYAAIAFDKTLPFPGVYALFPVVGTVLVIAFAGANTLAAKCLSLKPVVAIGLISYSAYLWHQPLFAFARIRFFEPMSSGLMLALAFLALVLAALSWRFVEQPFRQKGRFSRNRIFVLSAAFAVFLCAFGVAGHLSGGFAFRVPAEGARLMQISDAHAVLRDDGGCNRQHDETFLAKCVYGDAAHPDIAIVGDSHAAALASVLGEAVADMGRAVVVYTKNACPPVLGLEDRGQKKCAEFVEKTLADLRASKDIRTIIIAARMGYYLHDAPFDNGLGGTETRPEEDMFSVAPAALSAAPEIRRAAILSAFAATIEGISRENPAKQIILYTPIPEQGWHVPQRLAKSLWWHLGDVPSLPRQLYDERHEAVLPLYETFAGLANLRVIHSADLLCSEAVCASSENGEPLYYDDDHLSVKGAQRLVNAALELLKE